MGVLDDVDGVTCTYYDIDGVETCIRCRKPATTKVRRCIDSTEGFNPPRVVYKHRRLDFTLRRPGRAEGILARWWRALFGER